MGCTAKARYSKECIDGCEEMTVTEEGIFACVVAIKVGPVKARFTGTVKMVEPKPPHSYVLEVSARGGGAGFGSGRAEVNLQEYLKVRLSPMW